MTFIFVYNAKSGSLQQLLDTAHKIVSPQTYSCDLCALTHGSFRERAIWTSFKEKSAQSLVFYHKDEFLKAYGSKWLPKYRYPIVLVQHQRHGLEIGITAEEIAELNSTEDLIARMDQLIASYTA